MKYYMVNVNRSQLTGTMDSYKTFGNHLHTSLLFKEIENNKEDGKQAINKKANQRRGTSQNGI